MTTTTKKAAAKPATAKKPADRKPKSEPGVVTTDLRGLAVKVSADSLNDFELIDDMMRLDRGDDAAPLLFASILRRLVGDQFGDVMDLARDEASGRVPITEGIALVQELLGNLNPNS